MPAAHAALERNMAPGVPLGHALRMGLGGAAGEIEFDYYPGITALSTANSSIGQNLAGGLRKLLYGDQAGAEVQEILERTGATEVRENEAFVDELFRIEKVRALIGTVSAQIALHGLDAIDLLKIDTEGAEKEVLSGIDESDWPKIRQMMVEVHLGAAERDLIERQLQERGFETSTGNHPLSQGGVPVYHIYARRLLVEQQA
jgi:FkbM family methyltransferase